MKIGNDEVSNLCFGNDQVLRILDHEGNSLYELNVTGSDSISINIIGGNSNRPGKSITQGEPGVYPVSYEYWNQVVNKTDGSVIEENITSVKELTRRQKIEDDLVSAYITGKCCYTCGQNGTTPIGQLLYGYIDDGNYNSTGRGAGLVIKSIPYTKYNLYVYFGSDGDGSTNGYGPIKVNNVWYPAESTGWGSRAKSRVADPVLEENGNYLLISDLDTDNLEIYGALNGSPSNTRCGIAGIQIINTGKRKKVTRYVASLIKDNIIWQNGSGEGLVRNCDWLNSNYSLMTLKNETLSNSTLTFDSNVVAKKIKVNTLQDKNVSLSTSNSSAITADVIDLSGSNSNVTLNFETNSIPINGGKNTIFNYAPSVNLQVSSGNKYTLNWNKNSWLNKVISGSGSVDVSGSLVMLNLTNTFTGSLTVLNGGLLKMGSTTCLNNSNTATVNTGGTLDVNGQVNNQFSVTLNGGKMINTGNALGTGQKNMSSITLTNNSEMNYTSNWGIIGHAYNPTTINLDNYTLTKKGSAIFYMISTTINGTGKISIDEGTINIANKGSYNCSINDGTIELNGGTLSIDSGKTFTIKQLILNSGTITNNGTIANLSSLGGNIDFNNISGSITFSDNVNVVSGSIKLSSTASTALANKSITLNDQASILNINNNRLETTIVNNGTVNVVLSYSEIESGNINLYKTNSANIGNVIVTNPIGESIPGSSLIITGESPNQYVTWTKNSILKYNNGISDEVLCNTTINDSDINSKNPTNIKEVIIGSADIHTGNGICKVQM